MSDCEVVELKVLIPKETFERLVRLTKEQNANLGNNVSRLLNIGIEKTYERWPGLKGVNKDE